MKHLYFTTILLLPIEAIDLFSLDLIYFRVSLYEIALFLCFLFTFTKKTNIDEDKTSRYEIKIYIIFILLVLSSVLNYTYAKNLVYNYKLSLNLAETLLLLYVTFKALRNEEDIYVAMKVFVIAALITSIIIIPGAFTSNYITGMRTNPANIGPMKLGVLGVGDRKVMNFAGIILSAMPIIITKGILNFRFKLIILITCTITLISFYSRSIYVAFFAQIMALFYLNTLFVDKEAKSIAKKIIGFIALLSLAAYFNIIWDHLVNLRSVTYQKRLEIFNEGLDLVISNNTFLFFGVGKGDYISKIENIQHNLFIDILTSTGLISLLIFLAIIVGLYWNLFKILLRSRDKQINKRISVVFIACISGVMVESMATPTMSARYMWALFAIIIGFIKVYKQPESLPS